AHILLADEINRATPKTQAALLEAMAEQQVTVAGTSYPLTPPFFVLATLNPIEMEGTYQLPEAQLDRFLFKVLLDYPSGAELERILGAKVMALLAGRPHITFEDVERVALPALRHRLVMSYLAEAAGVDAAQVVQGVLASARQARA